jgi:hypothetical protein
MECCRDSALIRPLIQRAAREELSELMISASLDAWLRPNSSSQPNTRITIR